jgi:hypothetical protein
VTLDDMLEVAMLVDPLAVFVAPVALVTELAIVPLESLERVLASPNPCLSLSRSKRSYVLVVSSSLLKVSYAFP